MFLSETHVRNEKCEIKKSRPCNVSILSGKEKGAGKGVCGREGRVGRRGIEGVGIEQNRGFTESGGFIEGFRVEVEGEWLGGVRVRIAQSGVWTIEGFDEGWGES